VSSRAYVAGCLAELGDFAEGRDVGEEAVRIAEAVEHSYSLRQLAKISCLFMISVQGYNSTHRGTDLA